MLQQYHISLLVFDIELSFNIALKKAIHGTNMDTWDIHGYMYTCTIHGYMGHKLFVTLSSVAVSRQKGRSRVNES